MKSIHPLLHAFCRRLAQVASDPRRAQRRLVSDQGLAYARKRLAERLGELTRQRDGTLDDDLQRLDKLVRQIDKLVNFVADGHGTAAFAEKLRGLERAADAQRSKVAVLERRAQTAIRLPSPDELMGIVFEPEKRLSADATQAREELRRTACSTDSPAPRRFFE